MSTKLTRAIIAYNRAVPATEWDAEREHLDAVQTKVKNAAHKIFAELHRHGVNPERFVDLVKELTTAAISLGAVDV